MTCAAVTTWPEVRPHGVRLACCLPVGHDGEHACADVEYLADPEPTEPLKAPENATSQASGAFQPAAALAAALVTETSNEGDE